MNSLKPNNTHNFVVLLLSLLLFMFGACTSSSTEEKEEKTNDMGNVINTVNTSKEIQGNTSGDKEVVTAAPSEKEGKTASLAFEETEFNFGEAKEGDLVKHTFTFTNTGEIPLVIESASASCGCTVPNYPKEPIAPGAKSKIDVEFDTKGKAGIQNKTVTITANTNPAISTLKLSGNVKGSGTNTKQLMGPVRQ